MLCVLRTRALEWKSSHKTKNRQPTKEIRANHCAMQKKKKNQTWISQIRSLCRGVIICDVDSMIIIISIAMHTACLPTHSFMKIKMSHLNNIPSRHFVEASTEWTLVSYVVCCAFMCINLFQSIAAPSILHGRKWMHADRFSPNDKLYFTFSK